MSMMSWDRPRLGPGLFGMVDPTFGQMQDVTRGPYSTPPFAPETPAPAYVNGAGGTRLTPEMIAQRGKMAQGMIAGGMDTSPVGHWTQGLARIAQAIAGNMQQNGLDKASERNAADSQTALGSLGSGNEQTIAGILANPYVNDGVKDVAKLQWQATHRAPAQPGEFERTLMASGINPGTPEYTAAMAKRRDNMLDPFVMGQTPSGFFSGPRSLLEQTAQEGGDPISGGPAAGGSPAPSETFADAAQAGALIQSMGPQGFLSWQGKHGTGIRVNSPEEMARLPVGTKVISPDGRVGVKR